MMKVACVGGTATYGSGVAAREVNSYPAQLQELLGPGYDVRNFGRAGATLGTSDSLFYLTQSERDAALRFQPDIVLVQFGLEESRPSARVAVGEFFINCRELVSAFRVNRPWVRVVLLLPPPSFGADSAETNPVRSQKFLPALRTVAYEMGCEVVDLHALFANAPVFFLDGTDPSSLGCGVIASRLYEVLTFNDRQGFDLIRRAGIEGTTTQYFGYRCTDFTFEGREAKVVLPKRTAEGTPWVWRARFWGHEPQTEISLLEHGFHLVYCDVAELFGNDEAVRIWDSFYSMLTSAGLAEKPALMGFSRGGIYVYRWAVQNPGKVACVYADAPVLDLKSWPGGKGKGKGNPEEWERFKQDFRLSTEAEALTFKGNPLDLAGEIVRGGYPMLHVCGEVDEIVPIEENTDLFEKKVRDLGGDITVIRKPGIGHHPHSLVNPQPIMDFILRATGQKVNFAVLPVPGNEYRPSSGLKEGMEWHGAFAEMNRLAMQGTHADIILLGNSITQGTGGTGRSVTHRPGEGAFSKQLSPWTWVNFGISGDRTQHILWRVINGDWPSLHPRCIVLTCGVNNFPSDTGEEVALGIESIVREILRRDDTVKILLVGPLPAMGPGHPYRRKFEIVHQRIANLADNKRVFSSRVAHDVLEQDGSLGAGLFSQDGIHLTEQGYERWAMLLAGELRRVLK